MPSTSKVTTNNHAQDSDSNEFQQLTTQIDSTISNLKQKRDYLQDQLAQFESVRQGLKTSGDSTTPVKFQLDDGTMIEKTTTEAIEFLDKRVTEIKEALTQFNTKINEAESTKEKLNQFNQFVQQGGNHEELKQEKLNEDGLPFVDIQEELDEDGNVINVQFKDAQEDTTIDKNEKDSRGTPKVEILGEEIDKAKKSDKVSQSESDEFQALLEDMEVISKDKKAQELNFDQDDLLDKIDKLQISAEDKFKLKQVCVEEFKNLEPEHDTDKTQENSASDKVIGNFENLAIDKNDLIELELLADDFDDSENFQGENYDDDEEWDYEFDDDDEEEEEDIADELLYGGGKAKIIGSDEKSNNMLWDQIINLRKSKLVATDQVADKIEESTVNEKKPKAVRFAEHLDINEVENISESLRNPPPETGKMSLFKQNRMSSQQKNRSEEIKETVENDSVMTDILENDVMSDIVEKEPVMTDIIEKDDDVQIVDNSDIIESSIIEREPVATINESTPETKTGTSSQKPVSRFKAMRSSQPLKDTGKLNTQAPVKIPIPGDTEKEVVPSESPTSLSVSKLQDLQSDMDKMAQAYVSGMYDDDIVTEGPVVHKLDDFETLNKMVEAKKQDNEKLGIQEYDAASNEVGMEIDEEDEDDDEGPILVDEIVENELDESNGVFNDEVIFDREIRENYHKLRNKLILDQNGFKKSQQELEMEPVDDEGNPIKISRFKAAKMNRGG
ncbi:hypothetical protein MG3_04172 [Candida albicans P78048]|uniref:DUF3835 domain-containing protein n=1 Tax=Candida albicans P78048 TaxID=1094989 RepID=A0AB34PQP3_CANAX|nr:hypothetical protein MG3_04172 [Candida albicans P78048]